jgi:hypothetical protein
MKCQLHGQPGVLAMERGGSGMLAFEGADSTAATNVNHFILSWGCGRARGRSGECKPLIKRCLGRLVGIEL